VVAGSLPAEHPMLVAIEQESDLGSDTQTLDGEIEALRQMLADLEMSVGPQPEEIMRQAHEQILAAPSRSAGEVRASGQDPDALALIRLPAADGGWRLPSFQFDRHGQPLPVVLAINRLLGAEQDPWGVASWWLRANAWLTGVPAALLTVASEQELLFAARAEIEGG
jgi:hypothetical protein